MKKIFEFIGVCKHDYKWEHVEDFKAWLSGNEVWIACCTKCGRTLRGCGYENLDVTFNPYWIRKFGSELINAVNIQQQKDKDIIEGLKNLTDKEELYNLKAALDNYTKFNLNPVGHDQININFKVHNLHNNRTYSLLLGQNLDLLLGEDTCEQKQDNHPS